MPILGAVASSRLTAVPNSYESIATTTVGSGGSSTIDFTSIPTTYKHLQIRIIARTTATNNNSYSTIRFNNDTSTNYTSHQVYGTGSGSPGAYGVGDGTFIYAAVGNAQSAPANTFGPGVIDILDYASTSKFKTLRGLSGSDSNGGGIAIPTSGLWRNSGTAISSIQITTDGTSFAQNSQFALYGIKDS